MPQDRRDRKLVAKDPFETFRTKRIVKKKEDQFRRESGRKPRPKEITRRILHRQAKAKEKANRDRTRKIKKLGEDASPPPPHRVENYFRL